MRFGACAVTGMDVGEESCVGVRFFNVRHTVVVPVPSLMREKSSVGCPIFGALVWNISWVLSHDGCEAHFSK